MFTHDDDYLIALNATIIHIVVMFVKEKSRLYRYVERGGFVSEF